jgi:O-antigen ligase
LSALALTSRRPTIAPPQALIVCAGVSVAIAIGVALAVSVSDGLALLLATCFGLVLAFAPVWALICFVPLVFLDAIPTLNTAGKAAGLIVAAAWIGAVMTRRLDIGPVLRRYRRLFECVVLMVIWFALSALWAKEPSASVADIWHWVSVGLLFVIVATWIDDERRLLWICGAFVLGAVLSVVVGLGQGSLTGGAAAEARLEGAAGDPNFLAAGLVPAIVLAAGLIAAVKHPLVRWGCALAIVICAYGIAASQSRGGIIALVAVALASLVVFRRRRALVVVACLGVISIGAVYFSVTPEAWQRVSQFSEGGSGRSDLWSVAWRAYESRPINGVGLHNYEAVAKEYTREPGELSDVNKIAENPHVVHNTYLETLTNTGVVGLILFLFVALGCCYFAWKAGQRFEELDEPAMEAISRAILVGTIGIMAAAFFISVGVDRRLWMLFALGPASLAIAEGRARRTAGREVRDSVDADGRSVVRIPARSVPSR